MLFSLQSLLPVILSVVAVNSAVVPAVDTSGHFHATQRTDEPQGKNITINGVLTYVSLPKGDFDPSTAVLLLTGELVSLRLRVTLT